MEGTFLTQRKAAKFLKIKPRKLLELVKEGKIDFSVLDGKTIIFCLEDLQEYLRRPMVELDMFIELICKYHILN